MLNWIWLGFLLIAVVVAGFTGKLPDIINGTPNLAKGGALEGGAFDIARIAVMNIALPLIGLWAIWLGMMRLAEQSGLVQKLAQALRPILRRLFPEVPPEHPAMGAMVLNMAANMLGLGNAATPLGLRAMAHLDRLNPHPGVASNAMCTFLALNTASIQLIPTTAIGVLAINKATNPTGIVPAAFLSSLCAALVGVGSAKLLERLPIFRARPMGGEIERSEGNVGALTGTVEVEQVQVRPLSRIRLAALIAFVTLFAVFYVLLVFPEFLQAHGIATPPAPESLKDKGVGIRALFALGVLAIPFLLSFFPLYAALRGVRVYEQFVEGAKEAFDTAKRVIPFLVAMLVSIEMLRRAGVIDRLQLFLQPLFQFLHFPADLLPMVLMRPLSGSATNGIFMELVQKLGGNHFTSQVAATIFGSTETTFYVIAVYFGAVAIRQTRHAVAVGLIADATAVVASIFFCNLLFT